MLWTACHKARRDGFGMKMVFTHSAWWLFRGRTEVTEGSWSRNSSRAFPPSMNNWGKLCRFEEFPRTVNYILDHSSIMFWGKAFGNQCFILRFKWGIHTGLLLTGILKPGLPQHCLSCWGGFKQSSQLCKQTLTISVFQFSAVKQEWY